MASNFSRWVIANLLFLLTLPLYAQPSSEADDPEIAEALPEHLSYFYERSTEAVADEIRPLQGLVAGDRVWVAADTLKVCFFGGSPHVKKVISLVASKWSDSGNISFDFGTEPNFRDCRSPKEGFSQIRIGFAERGYWSSVGTDSDVLLNARQPSMNLQGFDKQYMEAPGESVTKENLQKFVRPRDRGTILHEFGHALGLLHEAQNPNMNCKEEIRFEGPDGAYAYYAAEPNNWSREKTDRNLGPANLVDHDAIPMSRDPKSNMMYSLPAKILLKGIESPCYVGENNDLSDGDKKLIGKLYPRNAIVNSEDGRKNAPAPMAVPMAIASSTDHIERIKVDLQSSVTTTRREARRQLAAALPNMDGNGFVKLVDKLSDGNYRARVGIVEAIRRAQSLPELSAEQKKRITGKLKKGEAEYDEQFKYASGEATKRLDFKM